MLGKGHTDTLTSALDCAATLRRLAEYELARDLYQDTPEGLTAVERGYPDIVKSAQALAATPAAPGRSTRGDGAVTRGI